MGFRLYNKGCRYLCYTFFLMFILPTVFFINSCSRETEIGGDEGSIKDAIARYDKALIVAYRKLNDEPLAGVASEIERVKNRSLLLNFKKNKIYMESEVLEMRYEGFKRKSSKEVDAAVREKWRWRHVNFQTGQEAKPWREEEMRLNYHMIKETKRGWIVDSLEFAK